MKLKQKHSKISSFGGDKMISSLHRPTKAVIDLDAICQNIDAVKANIPQDKKLLQLLKLMLMDTVPQT